MTIILQPTGEIIIKRADGHLLVIQRRDDLDNEVDLDDVGEQGRVCFYLASRQRSLSYSWYFEQYQLLKEMPLRFFPWLKKERVAWQTKSLQHMPSRILRCSTPF